MSWYLTVESDYLEPHSHHLLTLPEPPDEQRKRLRYRYDWGLPTHPYDLAEERLYLEDHPITRWNWGDSYCKNTKVSAGLTQAEMGELMGVSSLTICRWEQGTRRPYGGDRRRYITVLARLRQETLEYLDGLDLPEFDPEDAWWNRGR